MEGHFDVNKFSARGLKDEAFQRAIDGGYWRELLADLPHKQKISTDNMIYDRLCPYLIDALFPDAGGLSPENSAVNSSNAMLAYLHLTTEDKVADYSYRRHWNDTYSYDNPYTSWPSVVSGTGKRFEEDQIEDWTIWQSADGRESIHFRNKWLYLPTQGSSSNINGIVLIGREDGDTTGASYYHWRVESGYVRFKDVNGNKVTLTKNTNEVLLVEYTFTMVSM